jgi:hypothetical protein
MSLFSFKADINQPKEFYQTNVDEEIYSALTHDIYICPENTTICQSGFNPRQRQGILPLTTVSRPALGPTQPPIRWVPEVLSRG